MNTEAQLLDRLQGSSLTQQDGYYLLVFTCMGTQNRLLFAAPDGARARAFRAAAFRWLARFEATYSVFLPDSLVSRINAGAARDWVAIDAETAQVFALCDWYFWKTQGALDPTVGPLLKLWDFRREEVRPPSGDALEAARRLVGWGKVERRADSVRFPVAGMAIDLGGIGKEYAVDRLVKLADQHNIANILVDLGHDLRVAGQPPEGGAWRLGLEHPEAPGRCWGGVGLANEALCGSGNYLRYFEHEGRRYGHILDPRTGMPVDNDCRAAWVLAPTAVEAGALATAVLILGVDDGLRLLEQTYQAAGCIWCGDKLYQTRRFAAHVLQEQAVRA